MLLLDYKKICTKCGEEKSCTEFHKRKQLQQRIRNIKHINDGYNSDCKQCHNEANNKRYYKNHEANKLKSNKTYHKNRDAHLKNGKLFRKQNKEKVSQQKKVSYQKNKDHYIKKSQTYYQNNKDTQNKKCVAYITNKLKTDPYFRLSFQLRTNFKTKLRRYKLFKWSRTYTLTGCTVKQLAEHLQQTAINNGYMNFNIENYSGKEYHIDHIIPCAAFNLKCRFHQKLCFNYTNLQILKANENMKKGSTIPEKLLLVA